MKPCAFNWSSGKDSALALYYILKSKEYTVQTLVTNVNSEYGRVSMHGLREGLLDLQAQSLGKSLYKIKFNGEVSMYAYEEVMRMEVNELVKTGVEYSIYGDIFLEDLKLFRQKLHDDLDIKLVYPLWNRDTKELLYEFIELGFKAIPICVNANKLDKSFLGRVIDYDFIKDLPNGVDPCGENGEFHTFVYDGPIFKHPVDFQKGEIVKKDYTAENGSSNTWDSTFWYLDLLPK